MFFRSLLTRSGVLRLSQTCSRALGNLHPSRPTQCAVPSYTNLRRFSVAPAFREGNRVDSPTPPAPSGTCYIGNIPYKVTAEQLKEAFSEMGKVESVRLMTTDSGLSRGVGFIRFESVAEAVKFVEAHATDPIYVLDRQLYVEHAQRPMAVRKPVEPSDTLVLPDFQGESDVEVRSMFKSYADRILAVRFSRKEADWRKAYVQFRDVNVATEAMDVFKNENQNIRVTYARHRQPPANLYTLTSRLSQQRAT